MMPVRPNPTHLMTRVAEALKAEDDAAKHHTAAVKAARAALGNACTHPEPYRVKFSEDAYNGYRHRREFPLVRCALCQRRCADDQRAQTAANWYSLAWMSPHGE